MSALARLTEPGPARPEPCTPACPVSSCPRDPRRALAGRFPHLGTEGVCTWKTSRVNAHFRPQRLDPQPIRDGWTGAHSIANPSTRFPWGPGTSVGIWPCTLPGQDSTANSFLPLLHPHGWPQTPAGTPCGLPSHQRDAKGPLEKCGMPLPRHLFRSIARGERYRNTPPGFQC